MNNISNIDVFLKVEAQWITVEYGITLDFLSTTDEAHSRPPYIQLPAI